MAPQKVRQPGGVLPAAAAALEVQRPPEGRFNASNLVFVPLEAHGGVHFPCAVIPVDRVDDFVAGWGAAAGTNAPVLRQTKVNAGGGVHRFYLCQRATIPGRKAPALKAKAGKRGVGQLKGNQTALKCDCPAKFDVTLYGDGYAIIWLRDAKHNHDVSTMPKFLEPWVSEMCTVRRTALRAPPLTRTPLPAASSRQLQLLSPAVTAGR